MLFSVTLRTRAARRLGAAVVVTLLVCSACVPALPLIGNAPAATIADPTPRPNSGATRIGKALRGDLNGILTFAAPIQAKGEVAVVPRVIAPITQLNVDVGS